MEGGAAGIGAEGVGSRGAAEGGGGARRGGDAVVEGEEARRLGRVLVRVNSIRLALGWDG